MALSTPDAKQLRARNRQWLQAMADAKQSHGRLHWRNALVCHNLALVRQVANRLSQHSGHPLEELVSAGNLGLIRAVEAFDLKRDGSLSSFAVPYIRGAMLHDLRDNQQPLKTPRRLRELHQRAHRLIEQRRQQGQSPHRVEELAGALGCTPCQLEAAEAVQRALQVRSLDALELGEDGTIGCLLDQLASPPNPDNDPEASTAEQWHWLQGQLAALPSQERALLEEHWLGGLGWKQLGLKHRLSPQEAKRRTELVLEQLKALAQQFSDPDQGGQQHRQQGGNRGLQRIHQLIAQPGAAPLQGGADAAFDQGGRQSHQGHQPHDRGVCQKAQGCHQQGHPRAAQQTGRRALEADRPLGAGWHGPQRGDQHGVAAPALADLATKGVGQLGRKTGGKPHQQQGLGGGRKPLGGHGQNSPRRSRPPDVLGTAPTTPALRQSAGLLGGKTELGDQRSKGQVGHHRQPAAQPQTAPQQGSQDAGMHPPGLGEQR